jgi:DNA-binding NtrC family response regulator
MGGASLTTETTITDYGERRSCAGGTHAFHLLIMSPEVFASQPLPPSGAVSLGRSASCAVRLDDAMASREHARLDVTCGNGTPKFTIADLGSANGTRVRDALITPAQAVEILPGEAIHIGATVMMVLQDWAPPGNRRVWSHAYFESRVDDECARAARSRASFALARVHLSGAAPWAKVMPVMARYVAAPHVFAAYGPADYEILFVDASPVEVDALVQKIDQAFQAEGLEPRAAVAWYPEDGRTGDALLGTANLLVKSRPRRNIVAELALSATTGMSRVRALAMRAAPSSINVLIQGEMGVGKDVLARTIHQMSKRADQSFLALNCGGIPEALLESELFGHEKGAFTGASISKPGLFEAANGGTIFLDEIGEMPVAMQVKLLQVLETREVRPVGGRLEARPIDVRFISATNIDIEAAVKKGTFRGDLMYRLNTLTLAIPPLRERRDEIAPLAATFLAQQARELGRDEQLTVSADAMACLLGYSWPGNIRELKNVIERAVLLCDGSEITPEHLPLEKLAPPPVEAATPEPTDGPSTVKTLTPIDDPKAFAERQKILDALESCGGNQKRAAARLGISRTTLSARLDLYGIPRPQKGHSDGDEPLVNLSRDLSE